MSWWDTSNFSSLASNALKNAQKKIDKVLDIDHGAQGATSKKPQTVQGSATQEGDFWSGWLGGVPGGEETTQAASKDTRSKSPSEMRKERTSWSSWGFGGDEGSEDVSVQGNKAWDVKQSTPSSSSPLQQPTRAITPTSTEFKPDVVKAPSPIFLSHDEVVDSQAVAAADFEEAHHFEPDHSSVSSDVSPSDRPRLGGIVISAHEDVNVVPVIDLQMPGDSGDFLQRQTEETKHPDIQGLVDTPTLPDLRDSSSGTFDVCDNTDYAKPDSLNLGPDQQNVISKNFDDLISDDIGGESEIHTTEESVVADSATESQSLQTSVGIPQDTVSSDLSFVSLESEGFIPESLTMSRDMVSSRDIDTVIVEQLVVVDNGAESNSNASSYVDVTSHDTSNMWTQDDLANVNLDKLDMGLAEVRQSTPVDSLKSESDCDITVPEFCDIPIEPELPIPDLEPLNVDRLEIPSVASTDSSVEVLSDSCIVQSPDFDPDSTQHLYLEAMRGPDASDIFQSLCSDFGDMDSDSLVVSSELTMTGDMKSEDQHSLHPTTHHPSTSSLNGSDIGSGDHIDLATREHSDSASETSRLDSSMETCTSDDTVVNKAEEVGLHLLTDADSEVKGHNSPGSNSSTSSYVKNLLEDAIEDGTKHSDGDDNSHSSSEKSDLFKSGISGHDSGDDIDTTTSSDIEIISTPTPNGENRILDFSPLRISLRATKRERDCPSSGHNRNDSAGSHSTSSTYSSKPEQLSPGRDWMVSEEYEEEGRTDTGPEADDPYNPEKLLKKLAEMAEVLHVRETKLVQLSKDNNDLLEGNSILRNQLQQSEETREAEVADLNQVTEEFTQRLGESDRKLQLTVKEKDALKRQLDAAIAQVSDRSEFIKFQRLLDEKEEQVSELMQEGEKLSKQQLQTNTILRKLRAKEKENETQLNTLRKKVEDQNTELDHLRKVLDSKEEMEAKQKDAISQLNSAVQSQDTDYSRVKSELEDSVEKMRSMQAALDTSYREIAELHRSNAAMDSRAQEVALSAETQAREELKMTIDREGRRYKQDKEMLVMQIDDLRLAMTRMEKEHNRREDMLRQEISDLQQQLQEDEARNQELTHSVTSATRPLLRQIQNLQSTYTAQSLSGELVEKNLTDRLADSQSQLSMAVERHRVSSEKLLEFTSKVTSLESQNSRLRQEKSQLTAQLEMIRTKAELMEDARENEKAQIDTIKESCSREIGDLKKDKLLLENQLEMEKTKVESEKKKSVLLQEQLREKVC